MKLIRCHIENFGKLNNKDFIFESHLTSFCFGNGYGKSTLTAFIKAMLYGLKGSRANAKDFEDRRKYFPFAGGVFGGSLTFLHDGEEYTVERIFDVKSEVKDTLKVYSHGEITDVLGTDIGQLLFGLDAESFERVMLMNSSDSVYGGSGDISARLWGSEAESSESFDEAYARLDARKKQLKAARGKGGEISSLDEKILFLKQELENTDRKTAELDFLYRQRNEAACDINKLEAKAREFDAAHLIEEKKKTYKYHLNKIASKQAELERIKALYPNGILPEDCENEIKAALSELERKQGARAGTLLANTKLSRLTELCEKFPDIKKADADITELCALAKKYDETENTIAEANESVRFAERFSGREPKNEEIETQKANAANYESLTKFAEMSIEKGFNFSRFALICAAILFLVAGAGLIFVFQIAGILLLSAGAIALISAFLFNGKEKTPAKILKEASETEASISKFLRQFGYNTDGKGAAAYAFKLFVEEYELYSKDKQRSYIKTEEKRLSIAEREILKRRINQIVTAYSYPELRERNDFISAPQLIMRELLEYKSLVAEREREAERITDIDSEVRSLTEKTKRLLWAFISNDEKEAINESFSPSKIRELTDKAVLDRAHLTRGLSELDELVKTAEDYKRASGLDDISARDAEGLLNGSDTSIYANSAASQEDFSMSALAEKRAELARLEQRIYSIEAEAEAAEEQRALLTKSEEEREVLLHEYKMLDAAMNALKEAEHTLSEKYIAPVRDKFISYASRVEESIGEKYTMDKSFNIRFEEGGMSRDERHLSQGQHAVISLALRLSLIDAMYGDNCFVILDDPFSSLDETNFKKMQALIKSTAKNRQIVYFTCHNSRKI